MTMRATAVLLLSPILVSVFAFACSSSDSPATPTTTTPGDDAGADAASSGESLTILVVKGTPPPAVTEPLANANVIFDKPGGERVEAQAGPDGLVTITGIDWSKGTAAITAFGTGVAVASGVELTKAEIARTNGITAPKLLSNVKRDFTWFVFPDPTSTVKLTGAITNSTGDAVLLSPTTQGTVFEKPGLTYELQMKGGPDPFSLIALEHSAAVPSTVSSRGRQRVNKRWSKLDHAATTGDTAFDVDLNLGTVLTPVKLKGKVLIPGGKAGPFGNGSNANVFLQTRESQKTTLIGNAPKIDVSADGESFEFDFEYVKLDGTTPIMTCVIGLLDGTTSFASLFDLPTDGMIVDKMLLPPVVVEASRSFSEPFAIDGVEPTDDARVVANNAAGMTRWSIQIPPGVKTFTPPKLEGAAKAAVGKVIQGAVVALREPNPGIGYYSRAAASRPFAIK